MTRRSQVQGRGFCGIGIEHCKTTENIGTLWRSAVCLGADFIFTIGRRYRGQASDTVAATKTLPLWEFESFDSFNNHRPYNVPLVGVELVDDAYSLETFTHPERAIYLLGPEDGNLSRKTQEACQAMVRFQSSYCLNVASAGSIILYDRQAKQMRDGNRILP